MGVFFLLNTGQLPFIRWSGHSHLVGHVSAFRYGSGYMDIGVEKKCYLKIESKEHTVLILVACSKLPLHPSL